MSEKILAGVFWVVGAFLLIFALVQGGWALLIPLAMLITFILFGIDLLRHRELVEFDFALLRTLLHLLSAVAVASTCMFWLGKLLLSRGG